MLLDRDRHARQREAIKRSFRSGVVAIVITLFSLPGCDDASTGKKVDAGSDIGEGDRGVSDLGADQNGGADTLARDVGAKDAAKLDGEGRDTTKVDGASRDAGGVDGPAADGGVVLAPIKWVKIKAGSFMMGSPKAELCREKWSSAYETQHKVTLTRSFNLSSTSITQGQFNKTMGSNPAKFPACGSNCPVEQVTWHLAAAFCNALSKSQGLIACYDCTGSGAKLSCKEAKAYAGSKIYTCKGIRLPTEAEWEYAYRAGTTTAFYSGAITKCTTNDPKADQIAWYQSNASARTHPVGQKAPNAWGLYDMGGNVWNWVNDYYKADLGSAAVTDPAGPSFDYSRVQRGGSWGGVAAFVRAAHRDGYTPIYLTSSIGFRVAQTL